MIDPTPEQIEAAADAMEQHYDKWSGPDEEPPTYADLAEVAIVAAAGAAPQVAGGDHAALTAEARSRAEHPATGSNVGQCLRECADALGAAGNAPVQVDEAKLASLLQEHRPSQWRSFANDTIVYRCCKQDFGRLIGRPRKADRDPRELWEEHMANVIAEWWRGGGR